LFRERPWPLCIYEEEFLGFSYGFRPKRGQHDALDELVVGITTRQVNFISDADVASKLAGSIRGTPHRRQAHHLPYPQMAEGGCPGRRGGHGGEIGTGQGSVISPLLANISFDLWANRWRQHEAQGDMVIVRYADDFVVGFEHEADARRFWDALRARLEEFALSLHPDN
jgi:retron-type reverse transcriptase